MNGGQAVVNDAGNNTTGNPAADHGSHGKQNEKGRHTFKDAKGGSLFQLPVLVAQFQAKADHQKTSQKNRASKTGSLKTVVKLQAIIKKAPSTTEE